MQFGFQPAGEPLSVPESAEGRDGSQASDESHGVREERLPEVMR
jgi:hypothetical protein